MQHKVAALFRTVSRDALRIKAHWDLEAKRTASYWAYENWVAYGHRGNDPPQRLWLMQQWSWRSRWRVKAYRQVARAVPRAG
jgi:hypothetical protein